jgi:hypothetical protein
VIINCVEFRGEVVVGHALTEKPFTPETQVAA